MIVATDNLSKEYDGVYRVQELDIRIKEGDIYGFLGPNGAGKSTTMKMLLGLVKPTSGTIEIMGKPFNEKTRRDILASVGSLIESPSYYGHLTGRENMEIIRRLLDLPQKNIEEAVHIVRMENQMEKKVKNYSLGMKQRLGIAMALARFPKLLILDEPTNGLDPAGIEEMRELIKTCLLYTSDAADDMQCVDLGGRRIIKKNFFKQKTAYEISECLVGSEMCIRDSNGVVGPLQAVPALIPVSYTHLALPTICSV